MGRAMLWESGLVLCFVDDRRLYAFLRVFDFQQIHLVEHPPKALWTSVLKSIFHQVVLMTTLAGLR